MHLQSPTILTVLKLPDGSGFVMVATSNHAEKCEDVFPILFSKDMVNWEHVSFSRFLQLWSGVVFLPRASIQRGGKNQEYLAAYSFSFFSERFCNNTRQLAELGSSWSLGARDSFRRRDLYSLLFDAEVRRGRAGHRLCQACQLDRPVWSIWGQL